jgi:superfamily II DNA or RNA helicase
MEILERMSREQIPNIRTDIIASRKYGVTLTIEDQERTREAMRSRQLDAVAGGKIIEQGFDCPPLEVAILATPTKSKRLIEQVLGRCQRESPGKKQAILVDYIDQHVKILMYQFFNKNQKLYKNYWKIYD